MQTGFINKMIRSFLVTVMLLLALVGASIAHGAPIKIGFVLSTLQEERYQKDQKYFIAEAKRLGFEAVVVAAENNPQVQTSKVENLISQGVKALVIQPVNSQAAAQLVKLAHDDKIPVVAYDRMISDAAVDYFVTQDSFLVGVLQAEAAVKATKGKGNYVILMGQAGHSVANEITRGVESVLKKYPEIKVVMKKNHEAWSAATALATVENALTQNKNNIQAILANNSGMAHGAVQAVQDQKLKDSVFIAGADADLSSIKDILSGKQQFEVLKDIKPLAETAAQVAFALAQGKAPEAKSWNVNQIQSGKFKVTQVSTPVYPITKENVDERIFKTGFHSKESVLK